MGMEDHAIIIDYLPYGHPEDKKPIYKKGPLVYGIGEEFFTLMELAPKPGVELKASDRVYIGKEGRDKIEYVKRRVEYKDLSAGAKSELPYIVSDIVGKKEERFLNFFNEAQPITTRLHQLELLPGVGKKLMWEVLDERKKGPFKSLEDISKRVKLIPDAKKLIVKRITSELEGDRTLGKGKYKLFTSTPPPPRKFK